MRVKCIALSLSLGLTAWAGLGLVPATAIVDVPFDFHAGASALPAGTYVVDATLAQQNGTIWIKNRETGRQVAVMSRAGGRVANAAENLLVFHQYGDHHVLVEYRDGGAGMARKLPAPGGSKVTAGVPVQRIALHTRR
jgi:hypothetical protein